MSVYHSVKPDDRFETVMGAIIGFLALVIVAWIVAGAALLG